MKRVPRKKPKEHQTIDTMKPVLFTDLGSDNDPCFGKHYSLKAPECKRCGDKELCSIVSSTQIHKAIEQQEKKSPFIDVEEANLIDQQNYKLQRVLVNRAKKKEGQWLSFNKVIDIALDKFNLTDTEKPNMLNRLVKAAQDAGLTLNKSLTKYRYDG